VAIDSNVPSARPNTAPFLFGGLIGFVAGMAAAGVVAVWVYQSSPYRPETTPPGKIDPIRKAETKVDTPKPGATGVAVTTKEEGKSDSQRITPPAAVIAPGSNAPGITGKANEEPSPSAQARGRLWLQVGAYANAADAETQRARFAVLGYEAIVLSAEVPEKGTVHRVRVGPYRDPDEMGKARADLARQGIEVSVVKP
jgi:cell division protein FtsN